jgi:hypothetical protein
VILIPAVAAAGIADYDLKFGPGVIIHLRHNHHKNAIELFKVGST